MNSMLYFSAKKWCATLALLSFFAAAVFSISIGMQENMAKGKTGSMTPCAFMTTDISVCPMGVLEHISEWQALFAPVLSELALGLVFFAVPFLATAFLVFFLRECARQKRMRLYALNNFYRKSLHFLVALFSRGILNPRLYAFAVI